MLTSLTLVAPITHFTPTSSEPLDKLLSELRLKVFLPAFLSQIQRKKLFSAKYEKQLNIDPIVMEIDGEVIKLRHLSFKRGDIPPLKQSLAHVLKQLRTPKDFVNLRPLLEGVKQTGYTMNKSFYPQVTRVAGQHGQIFRIIECARSSEVTGVKLDSVETVHSIMHFVQMKALDARWDEEETRRALKWSDMVIDMLSDEAHRPSRSNRSSLPLSRDPQILLARLHLAAVLAKKYPKSMEHGKDLENLTNYARDIVRLWPEDKNLMQMRPEAELHHLTGADFRMYPIVAPLLHGLQVAQKVLQKKDAELARQLALRVAKLRAELDSAWSGIGKDAQWAREIRQQLADTPTKPGPTTPKKTTT